MNELTELRILRKLRVRISVSIVKLNYKWNDTIAVDDPNADEEEQRWCCNMVD